MRDGLIYPLTDVVTDEMWNEYPEFFANKRDLYEFYGELYGLPKLEIPVSAFMIYYNVSVFETLGITDPHELWEAGEWTWDTFRQVVETLQQDTTGDGEIDLFALNSDDRPEYWIWANDVPLVTDENGRKVVNATHPALVEAVEFCRDLRDDGYLHDGGRAEFTAGEVAMHLGGLWEAGIFSEATVDVPGESLPFDFSFVPLPQGPSADRDVYPYWEIRLWFFPVTTPNIEDMITLTNAFWVLTDSERERAGVGSWEEEIIDPWIRAHIPERHLLPLAEEMMLGLEHNILERDLYDGIRRRDPGIVRGTGDVYSALAAAAPHLQSIVDNIWGQDVTD